jgi:hypothetical protein
MPGSGNSAELPSDSSTTVAQKGTGREIVELASALLQIMDMPAAVDVLARGIDVGACSFEVFPLLHSIGSIQRRNSQVQALRVMKCVLLALNLGHVFVLHWRVLSTQAVLCLTPAVRLTQLHVPPQRVTRQAARAGCSSTGRAT